MVLMSIFGHIPDLKKSLENKEFRVYNDNEVRLANEKGT